MPSDDGVYHVARNTKRTRSDRVNEINTPRAYSDSGYSLWISVQKQKEGLDTKKVREAQRWDLIDLLLTLEVS